MLKKETIDQLAKAAGVNAEELAKAITEEKEIELAVNLPFQTFSKEEWEKFEKKIDEEKKERYDTGAAARLEMLIKEEKEKEGLSFEGKKFEDYKKHLLEKALKEAKMEPEKKYKELKADFDKIQEEFKKAQEKEKELEKEYRDKIKKAAIENEFSKIIPKGLQGIDPEDFAITVKNRFEFDFAGETLGVKKDGEFIKDKTREIIPAKEIVEEYAKEKKYLVVNGRGEGDHGYSKSGIMKTYSDFVEHCEKQGISPKGEEAKRMLSEIAKNNKDFDFEK